jgi:hypothetical protein
VLINVSASFVEVSDDLLEHTMGEISEVASLIGKNIADLIEDGSTLQLGIGEIPDAVLHYLTEKKHLGVHSEMVSDGVIDLIEAGIMQELQVARCCQSSVGVEVAAPGVVAVNVGVIVNVAVAGVVAVYVGVGVNVMGLHFGPMIFLIGLTGKDWYVIKSFIGGYVATGSGPKTNGSCHFGNGSGDFEIPLRRLIDDHKILNPV